MRWPKRSYIGCYPLLDRHDMLNGLDIQTKHIYSPIMEDLEQVEKKLCEVVDASPEEIRVLLRYALQDKGKRLRPAITLLASRLHPCDQENPVLMATAIELLHLATLIHDDTVDESEIRRGRLTVSKRWGGEIAVLLGDYVFGVSAVYVCDTRNVRAIRAFAETIRQLSHGQLLEYLRSFKYQQARDDYHIRISYKTASLFRTAGEAGAILAGTREEWIRAMAQYGHNLGMAFQVVDDILDYEGNPEQVGKPVGNDLLHGIVTLPALMLMERSAHDNPIASLFRHQPPKTEQLSAIVETIRSQGILEECYQVAQDYCDRASESLRTLPESPTVDSLLALTRYVLERRR